MNVKIFYEAFWQAKISLVKIQICYMQKNPCTLCILNKLNPILHESKCFYFVELLVENSGSFVGCSLIC